MDRGRGREGERAGVWAGLWEEGRTGQGGPRPARSHPSWCAHLLWCIHRNSAVQAMMKRKADRNWRSLRKVCNILGRAITGH